MGIGRGDRSRILVIINVLIADLPPTCTQLQIIKPILSILHELFIWEGPSRRYRWKYTITVATCKLRWAISTQGSIQHIGFLPVPSETSKVRNRATFIMRISIDRHPVIGARSCTITYIGMIPIVKAFSQCSGFGLQISTRIAIYFHSD